MNHAGLDDVQTNSVQTKTALFCKKNLTDKEHDIQQITSRNSGVDLDLVGSNFDDQEELFSRFLDLKVDRDHASSSSSGATDDHSSSTVDKPGKFESPCKKYAHEQLSLYVPSVDEIEAKGKVSSKIGSGGFGTISEIALWVGNTICYYARKRFDIENMGGASISYYDRAVRHEIRVSEYLRDKIQGYFKAIIAGKEPEYFLMMGSEFIIRCIGGNGKTSLFMEKASGMPLRMVIKNVYLKEDSDAAVDGAEIGAVAVDENDIKCKIILVGAKMSVAVAVLHENGIVHRDLKLGNVVCDPNNWTIKLIDFGISHIIGDGYDELPSWCSGSFPFLLPYCSSIEEYLSQNLVSVKNCTCKFNEEDELKCNYGGIMHAATDVYGLGVNLMRLLFGIDGIILHEQLMMYKNKDNKLFRECEIGKNIQNRCNLRAKLMEGEILQNLNSKLPVSLRYTNRQVEFIRLLILWCIEEDPTKRPTAAQVAYMLEVFAYGVDNFVEAQIYARIDRPTPPDYFSEQTIETYAMFGIPNQGYSWFKYHNPATKVVSPFQ